MAALQSVTQHLNPCLLSKLYRYGYCIIDNALSDRFANNILSEIKALQEFDIMYPCMTHSIGIDNNNKLIKKSNVWELELHSYPQLQSICIDLWNLLNDKSLINLFNNSKLSKYKYSHQTLKILYSINNGCFPIHFDSDSTIDLRRITAILYLNDNNNNNNNNNDNDGGQLRLYPLLSSPIDIIPKYNRLVLFSSCFMLHRTLPTIQQRYALNFWLHLENNHINNHHDNDDDDNDVDMDQYQYLLQPKYLKCVAKLLYNDEWTQSIIDSHKTNSEWLINNHKNDVKLCKKVLSSLNFGNNGYQNIVNIINDERELKNRYLSGDCWQNCNINWLC